jgi:hypothetical protein
MMAIRSRESKAFVLIAVSVAVSAADALLRLLPQATELPGYPEPPRPEFRPHLEAFLETVAAFATS